VEISATTPDPKAIARRELGLALENLERFCTIKHTITRYRITLEAWRAKSNSPSRKSARGFSWLTPVKLNAIAFTSAHRKILDKISP
jgi:adenine-specific DNA glycosylase